MDTRTPTVLLDGLNFPEGPRWHNGKLWFSDIYADQVMAVDLDGHAEVIVTVPGHPTGLGWLPDGRLLVVSQTHRSLYRLDPDGLHLMTDLTALTGGYTNDMVVDHAGRAYIGNFGAGSGPLAERESATLVLVTPDGVARPVGAGLRFPNGMVITPDGRTLIVAESGGQRLTVFDIAEDGSLSGRRIWASVTVPEGAEMHGPASHVVVDGICLDVEGAIWVGCPNIQEFLQVQAGLMRSGGWARFPAACENA